MPHHFMIKCIFALLLVISFQSYGQKETDGFVSVDGLRFFRYGAPYYYLGTNYWHGMNLAADPEGGNRERLIAELDHLKSMGVINLRIMAATEGPDTEPHRAKPSLQPEPGKYNEALLEGLDFLLVEMQKRDMTAILVMNNFWEWSGGMGQYVNWVSGDGIPYAPPAGDGDWHTFQSFSSSFYGNKKANKLYRKHLKSIIKRKNTISEVDYKDDRTIMSWQLANEPRGYAHRKDYLKWIHSTAKYIKKLDDNHLVSIGSEGNTASHHAGNDFYTDHLSRHIDYATMHIWIQNWGWFDPQNADSTMIVAVDKAIIYLEEHMEAARKLNKPMVLEEFGVARDDERYDPGSSTEARDSYFTAIFETTYQNARENQGIVGCNFWTYSGKGRPNEERKNRYWKAGDPLLGDPPHEKQGWYSVFDTDESTLQTIQHYAELMQTIDQ